MRTHSTLLTAAVLMLAGVLVPAAPAAAQTLLDGQTASGAYYQIAVPDGWAPPDGLVIWNHGFDLSPVESEPDLGPLVALQLAEGYAVAASSYSLNGWAVFETAQNNQEMVEVFHQEVGVPDQVIVTGASLGGIVTARDIEAKRLGNVVGALPICGVMGGSRIWNAGLDLRLVYDAICSDVPGAAIPGGANGLPFPPDPSFDSDALGGALEACFGLFSPPSARSAEQQDRLDQILAVSGIPEEFLGTDMGFVTFAMADLIYSPAKMGGVNPLGNRDVDYGDPEINADIERVDADSEGLERLLGNYTPKGRVGDVKIVSIHTDKDGLVIVENQSAYQEVVPANRLTTGIVVEDEPTHCGFTPAELIAAWESLRGWVAGLPQPSTADLQNVCEGLDAGGLADGPCRFDPDFVIPNMDGRIRPRSRCMPDADTLCLGEGNRFQVEVDWRTGNRSGAGRTVPTTDSSGSFWFFSPDNLELTVKTLDGRRVNGHFWVFYGSLTNVEFELTVTDTTTGLVKTYENPAGQFASVGDTSAF